MRASRRRHSEAGGQAVLEMALVLPICIALVMNFIAIMVVVRIKTEATTAISLAAQSAISAPVSDSHDACVYAGDVFYTTLFNRASAAYSGCPAVGSNQGFIAVSGTPPASTGFASGPVLLGCTTTVNNYFSGANYPPPVILGGNTSGPPVTCTTTVNVSFVNTPLAFAVFWAPTMTITAVVHPSTGRQACSTAACP